jgi:hypothetical protein
MVELAIISGEKQGILSKLRQNDQLINSGARFTWVQHVVTTIIYIY